MITIQGTLVEEPEVNWYAEVKWSAADVQTLRPSWTIEQCEAAIARHEKHLQDRIIELGWDVLEWCLNWQPEEGENE